MPGAHDLTRFVQSTFRSVWSLELLCHLRKNPDRDWAPEELIAALRASDLIVSEGLATLTAAGLVVRQSDGAARYQPAAPALASLVDQTVQLYARSPDAVRRMIVSAASSDISAFADDFRIRRD